MTGMNVVTLKSDYEPYAKKPSGGGSGRIVVSKKDKEKKFLQKLIFKKECAQDQDKCMVAAEDSDAEIIAPKEHESHNFDRIDAFREYLIAPLFKMSLDDRAPNITLVQNDKKESNKLYIHSEYLENGFKTLRQFFYEQKLSDGSILSDHVNNIEDVLAACLLWADNDWHADNIGVIKQQGRNFAAKIDHGNALISFHDNVNSMIRSVVSFARKYAIRDNQCSWQLDWGKLRDSLKKMMEEIPVEVVYSVLNERAQVMKRSGFSIRGMSFSFELDVKDESSEKDEIYTIKSKKSYDIFMDIIKKKIKKHFAVLEDLMHLLESDLDWLKHIAKERDPMRLMVDEDRYIAGDMAIIKACLLNCTFDVRDSKLVDSHKMHGFSLLNFGFMHCHSVEVKHNNEPDSNNALMSARRYLVKHADLLFSNSSCFLHTNEYYKIASVVLDEYVAHVHDEEEGEYLGDLKQLSQRLIGIAGNHEVKMKKIPVQSIALLLHVVKWQDEPSEGVLQYKACILSRCNCKSIYSAYLAHPSVQHFELNGYLDQVAAICNFANRCGDDKQAGWMEKQNAALKEVKCFASILNKTKYKIRSTSTTTSIASSVASSINGDSETPYLSEDEEFEAGQRQKTFTNMARKMGNHRQGEYYFGG